MNKKLLRLMIFLLLCYRGQTLAQESFYPSDQRIFYSGALADLNAAYIGRWDQMHLTLERSRDWAGFAGNPESGLLYFDTRLGSSNSSAGLGIKFDRIAAFKRNEINFSYAYSIKFLDNGYRPLRLILGFQPSFDIFRASYNETFADLYPESVPPEGLDQTTFGFNTGFLLTNGSFIDYEQNLWYGGLSSRISGIAVSSRPEITKIRHREFVLLTGLRQNINNRDIYLDAFSTVVFGLAGIDVAAMLNLEKYDPSHENAIGGWAGLGIKTNMQSSSGLKQLLVQAGIISRLFQGKEQLIRIGLGMETDLGPYTFLGNRYSLMIAFQK